MMKTEIFLLSALLPFLLGAIQPEIFEPPGAGAVPESIPVLRELGRRIEQLGRSSPPHRLRVTLALPDSGLAADAVEFSLRSGLMEVRFRADSPNWWRAPLLRRRLFSCFAAAAAGTTAPGDALLPDWTTAALGCQLDSLSGSERIMRSSQRFPLARTLAEAGTVPDLQALIAADATEFCPAEAAAFGEMSRILLESAVESGSVPPEFVRRVFAGGGGAVGRELLENLRERAESGGDPDFRRYLRRRLRHYACIVFNPRPAAALLADFDGFTVFSLPRLDRDGKPTGEYDECPLEALPARLEGRPDIAGQRLALARAFEALAAGGDRETRTRAAAIAAAARKLGDGTAAARAFAAARRHYREGLEYRLGVENALIEAERRCIPPEELFRSRLDGLRPAGDALLTREAAAWFAGVERAYLAEY